MKFENYKQFKNYFNDLFKKYHPDNKETGDANLFIKYKKIYDDTLNKFNNKEYVDITIDQAYNGCILKCSGFDVKLPSKFYYLESKLTVSDKGKLKKVYVKIKPRNDEIINLDKNENIVLTKIIKLNIFDIIMGCEKLFNVFGEEYKIRIKPYQILNGNTYQIKNIGYPLKNNLNKRNDLNIKLEFENIDIMDDDIKILAELREKYEKKI